MSYTKGYHGEGNGAAERAWAYVEARLCESVTLVDWRERLPCIAFSFNVAVRGGHGMSAFELQFGLPAVTALQAASLPSRDAAAAARPASETEARQLVELLRVNSELAQTARDFQRRATAELLRGASGSRRAVRFDVGDLVMVYREPVDVKQTLFTKPKDFVAAWLGPFVVLRVEGTCYTVQALCDGPGITAGAVLERTVKNVKAFKGAAPARAVGGGGEAGTSGGDDGDSVGGGADGADGGAGGGGGGGAGDGAGAGSWELEVEVPATWRPGTGLKFAHKGVEYSIDLEGDVVPGGIVAVRVPARGRR